MTDASSPDAAQSSTPVMTLQVVPDTTQAVAEMMRQRVSQRNTTEHILSAYCSTFGTPTDFAKRMRKTRDKLERQGSLKEAVQVDLAIVKMMTQLASRPVVTHDEINIAQLDERKRIMTSHLLKMMHDNPALAEAVRNKSLNIAEGDDDDG